MTHRSPSPRPTHARTGMGRVGRLWLLLAPLALAAPALAERVTDASEPVVISDDITNRATEVSSATGAAPPAAAAPPAGKTNRSGLGDGTNPGKGAGKSNSPNEGTDNPNNKPDGKSGGKGKP